LTLHDDSITMRQMLDHAREAIQFTADKSLDDVLNDRLLGLALARLIEILGEAANRISPDTMTRYPNVQWRQAIDTRNRVIHGYDTVDLRIIYGIIQNNLPPLVAELERILEQGEAEQNRGEN
jgi:uncharacterized protein with HEPN domain